MRLRRLFRLVRALVLPALLALFPPVAADELPDQAALREHIEDTDEAAAVPRHLAIYADLRSGLDVELRVGEDAPREDYRFSRKVTASGELVFTFSADQPDGEHSTEIITRKGPDGLLKRVRLMADGSTERLTGVVAGIAGDDEEPKPFDSAQHHIQWFGEVERDGEPTGETVVALEVVRSFEGEHFRQRSFAWSRQVIRDDQVVRREHLGFVDFEKVAEPGGPDAGGEGEPSGLGGLLKSLFGKKEAVPADPEPAVAAEPVVHEFDKLNFRFTHPEGRYVQMEAATVSPDATLALMQARPGRMFMIIAEELGEMPTFNLDSLVHVVRTNMRSVNSEVDLSEVETLERDGVTHRRFSSEAPLMNGRTGRWCHLVSLRRGFAYQLVLFSMEAGAEELVDEIDVLARNFELIDPNRVARRAGMEQASRHEAPAYGLILDASDANTIPWDPRDLAANFPAASFGVVSLDGGGLFVVPADLSGIQPTPELIARVLRALAGLGPEVPGVQVGDHVQGTGEGTKATASYDFQGTRYTHQVRVLVNRANPDRALALGAFGPGEGAAVTAKLEALLDLAEISATSGDPPPATATQADIANQFGLALHGRGDARAAIPFYEEARRRAPANAIYGLNLLQALNDAGLFEQGLDEVEAMMAAVDAPGENLRSWRASFLGAVGRNPEGIEIYDALFREGWRNDDDLLRFLQMLSAAGEVERALEVVDDYIGKHRVNSLNVRRWRGEIHSQAGRWEEALEIARALSADHPEDVGLRLSLVSALVDAGRGGEALDLLDQADFGATEEAVLLYHRGRALNLEREFVKAKECLEKAAAALPMLPGVQDELDLAAAMLGHGDQGAIRTPLEPVEIPRELSAALEPHRAGGAGGDGGPPGFSHRVDLSVTGIHFEPGSPLRRTEHREVTILTRAGLEEYRNIRFTFDPSHERAFVNRLEVLDAGGGVTSTGNPADYYVSSGTGGLAMATGERTVTAPVPGLSIGDRVRYSYTTETRAGLDEPPFERMLLAALTPSGPRAVFVTGAPEGLRGVVAGGDVTAGAGDHHRHWLLPEPPRFEFEELLPDIDRFLPSLVLGPASGSWEEIGRDYLGSIEDRLEAAPVIREKAAAFLREHPGEEDRVGAILRFVQSGVTYQAIEFGRRARIPNKAEACLSDRYGDCKDHSLLAHLLLRESGIPSQLVLVNTAATVEPGLPSLDQFDHMILRVGGRGEGRFFDCTAKHRDPSAGPGSALVGRRCLILHADDPVLGTVSGAGGKGNRVATERTVRYDPATNEFAVSEITRFRDEQAEWVRAYFSGTDRSQYADVLTRLLGSDHRLRIDEVEIKGLEPHDEEFVVMLGYRLVSALQEDGGRRTGQLPAVWEELYFKSGASASRKAPFELRAAYEFESACRFEMAGGPAATGAPSWKPAEAAHPWGKWSVNVDGPRQSARLQVDSGIFPKESFGDYRADQSAFLRALRGRISLPDPSPPQAAD